MDKGFCLIFLPVFFGHLLGSFAGLRVWLAVKGTSFMMVTKAEIETTPSSNGSSKTGLIAGIVAASSLILLTVGLGIGQVVSWESLFNFIFGSVLILPLTEAMFSCIYHLAGIRQTLHRNLDGALRLDPGYRDDGPQTPWRMLACASRVVGGIGLPAVTLYYSSDIGASLLLFAIVYAFNANYRCTMVFMHEVICTAVEIYTLLLWCIMCGFFVHRYRGKTTIEAMRIVLLLGGDNVGYWIEILLTTIPSIFIISVSLRLDFANHAASVRARDDPTDAPRDLVPLEVVEAPNIKMTAEQLTTGVVIPASLPFTFKCPYFTSTLLAWTLTNLAVMHLLAHGWLSDFGLGVTTFAHTLYVLVCALPMVLLSLVMVALVRGEVQRMWMYAELWQLPVEKKWEVIQIQVPIYTREVV